MAFPRAAARASETMIDVVAQRPTSPSALKHDLVVEAQPQLWHAREVALHLDSTQNLRAHDVSVRIDLSLDVSRNDQVIGGRKDAPVS